MIWDAEKRLDVVGCTGMQKRGRLDDNVDDKSRIVSCTPTQMLRRLDRTNIFTDNELCKVVRIFLKLAVWMSMVNASK